MWYFYTPMDDESLPLQPPEPDYVSEVYRLTVPANDKHLKDPWELRKYAAKLLEKKIGDEAQVTAVKLKMPGLLSRFTAKMFNKAPQARLRITVKF